MKIEIGQFLIQFLAQIDCKLNEGYVHGCGTVWKEETFITFFAEEKRKWNYLN